MASAVFDTSVLLRLVLPSQRDAAAEGLWQQCAESGIGVVIPSQGVSEVMSVIRHQVFSGRLSAVEGDQLFAELRALVASLQIETVQLGAWDVAKRFNRPNTYDSEFYALAESLGVEVWTADERFVNAMGQQRPSWVKRLSDL